MFNEIIELVALREQKKEIFERELKLSTPLLSDMKIIPVIYDWFQEIHADVYTSPDESNMVQVRKQFVFIILSLYSPQKLACGKMINGLRKELSRVIGLSTKTIVSNDSASLLFEYQTYKGFRKGVDKAYTLIMERLIKQEILTTTPLSAMDPSKIILY